VSCFEFDENELLAVLVGEYLINPLFYWLYVDYQRHRIKPRRHMIQAIRFFSFVLVKMM
jgi:hypothetical protein